MHIPAPPRDEDDPQLSRRAGQIFDNHMRQLHVRIDQMFVVLMAVQWVFAIAVVLWLSPFTWNGAERQLHPHVYLAIVLGGLLAIPAGLAGLWFPGEWSTRHLIAICQVGFSSLLIHLTGGRIETHFHVFGSLAFLAAYRDWSVLVPATGLVAFDHLVRGMFWPETVFGVATSSNWRWLEHAGWVLFEDLWLMICCRQGIDEVRDIAQNRAQLEQSQVVMGQQTVALEESLREREAIVEGALDAVVQMDSDGQIVGWNSQASRIFGWTLAEVMGRPLVGTIVSENNQTVHRGELASYFATARSKVLNQRIEVDGVRRDGTSFPIELAITPTRSNGRTTYCAFVRDISERRQGEEVLKQAKDAAEAANDAKSQFLANMSHEIRTPLNAILGFTDLMRVSGTELTVAERNSHLESVHRGGSHLLSIINDILDLSKIEAGQMQYERIQFSPHQVIADTLSFMRVRAEEKGISLEACWLGRVPETILSDPARFRQLLLNLIGNAMKFTERGGVQIVARLDSARTLLQIEVIDTGVGIAADKIDSLFTPFTQADVSVTRRFGGTGLGLSICRHIAQSLGGDIKVQSTEGHGSTFTVAISTGPLDGVTLLETPPREALKASTPSSIDASPRLDGLNVLIVDDGETNRQLLQLLLVRSGATVDTADHGLAAVERVAMREFDTILMDMQMPVLDGYSATRLLRERGVKTPVIALTAHAMSGEKEKCYAAGCDFFLTKPVDRQELVLAVSRLQASPKRKAFQKTNASVTSSSQMHCVSDASITSELDLTDPEIRRIVGLFVDRLDSEAEQMHRAWEARDWTSLEQHSHRLKGTAAMAGFIPLSGAAGSLEEAALQRDQIRTSQLLAEVRDLAGHCTTVHA